jgi:hypothetical protein
LRNPFETEEGTTVVKSNSCSGDDCTASEFLVEAVDQRTCNTCAVDHRNIGGVSRTITGRITLLLR